MSLYSLTKSFNKFLMTSTFPGIVQDPGEGLKMEGHQLCFDVDYRSY